MTRVRHAHTAIEIAVVMLAIGILAGAVVLSFRGGEIQATDRAAQANADVALDAMVTIASRAGNPGDPGRVAAVVPELHVLPAATTADSSEEVSIGWNGSHPDGAAAAVASYAEDGSCWIVRHTLEPAPDARRRLYTLVLPDGPLPCTGDAALDNAAPADDGAGTSWRNPVVIGPGE